MDRTPPRPLSVRVERRVSRPVEHEMKATNLELFMARRDALRALTYKTDAITAELERLYRLIERELWSASQ